MEYISPEVSAPYGASLVIAIEGFGTSTRRRHELSARFHARFPGMTSFTQGLQITLSVGPTPEQWLYVVDLIRFYQQQKTSYLRVDPKQSFHTFSVSIC